MNPGPSAFPVAYGEEQDYQSGMRLRDYFAAKALSGLLAREAREINEVPKIVEAAYVFADAMLAQRGKNL